MKISCSSPSSSFTMLTLGKIRVGGGGVEGVGHVGIKESPTSASVSQDYCP